MSTEARDRSGSVRALRPFLPARDFKLSKNFTPASAFG
jgi:hypothetical protein